MTILLKQHMIVFVQLKARLLRTVRMSRGPTSIVRSTTAPFCFDSKPRICQRSHFEALKAKNNQNMGPTCDSVGHQFDLLQINQITSTHCCNMSVTTCLPGISVNVENTTARRCVVCGKRTNIGQNTSCVPVYALALLTLLP